MCKPGLSAILNKNARLATSSVKMVWLVNEVSNFWGNESLIRSIAGRQHQRGFFQ